MQILERQVSFTVQGLPSLQVPPFPETFTSVVPEVERHAPTVTLTLYVPEAAAEADGIAGFCVLEVNPLGPVQA